MIMKTSCELQKKLNKLPALLTINNVEFGLIITKNETSWLIMYTDLYDNALLSVEHTSLQAAVDNTLASLKKIEYYNTPEGHLMSAIFGYKL